MASVQLLDAEQHVIGLDSILGPWLEARGGRATLDEMEQRLLDYEQETGAQIAPDGELLRRLALRTQLIVWLRKQSDDNVRRFAADRQGGRIDRRVVKALDMKAAEQAMFVASIERTMIVDLPGAYVSQARLLKEIDPTYDIPDLAERCGEAVKVAVLGADRA
jgi:hypothetical protein